MWILVSSQFTAVETEGKRSCYLPMVRQLRIGADSIHLQMCLIPEVVCLPESGRSITSDRNQLQLD